MRKTVTSIALVLFCLGAAALGAALVSSDASAEEVYRQFTGKIDKIDDKKVIVDNRKGDKVQFNKAPETAVSGEGKAKWEDLKKDDWVTVDWLFKDKPRKAYKVMVIPAMQEAGEEE